MKKRVGNILHSDKILGALIFGVGSILLLVLTLTVSSPFIAYQSPKASAAESTGPDLIIESITWSPESPSIDDIVTISVTVKNQGEGKAITSRLTFRVDGSFKVFQYVESLEAGDSVTKEFTWTAGQGYHQIQMIIDEDKTIPESDETNNEKSVTISTLTPDLIIETITWTPLDPFDGDNVTFSVTIMNQGEGKAINPLVVFHVDGKQLAADSLGTIASGNTDNTTFIWPAQADSHIIELIVDPNNSIIESNESNNQKIADFPTLSPDLIVQSITWAPEEPSVGDTVTFSVTIANQGRVYAASSTFSYYVGSRTSGTEHAPVIAADSSVVTTFTWAAGGGSNPVRVVLDTTNKVTESDESNNEMTVTFSGTKVADLVVQSLTWSPSNPSVGETMTFSVTIKNEGTGQAGSSQVTYYIDDEPLVSASVDPIEPGSTENTTFTWTVQEGSHSIKVITNANLIIPESNEENNEKTVVYPVPPDLVIKEVTLSPQEPSEGDNVTFTVTVENRSDINMAEGFNIGYYVDDNYLGFSVAEAVSSGATDNSSFAWVATAGRHNLKAIVDIHDSIIEADENNNEILRLFSVPELSITTTPPASSPSTTPDAGEGQSSATAPSDPVSRVSPNVGIGDGESKNSMLIYYLLGLGGIILIGVIFFEVWRRQE
ncbi:CARDB domain-containing protein [Chloroflexota bacterium]